MKYWQKLEELKKKGPIEDQGICENIEFDDGMYYTADYTSWFGWKKFSGCCIAPVPHDNFSDPIQARKVMPLWDKSTQYGRDRWELVDHLIVEFKKRDL